MRKRFFCALLAALFSVGFAWYGYALKDAWYIEDDPWLYAYVSKVENPIDFFVDRETIQDPEVQYLIGKNFTPAHFASFWIDNKLVPRNPAFAYGHTLIYLGFASFLLFLLLSEYVNISFSFLAIILLCLLPSTVVITGFLSTRHYLQSLVLCLAAGLGVIWAKDLKNPSRITLQLAAILLLTFSAFFKEVSIFFGVALVGLIFIKRREWACLAILTVLPIGWAVVRYSFTGLDQNYPGRPQSLEDLWTLLSSFPRLLINHNLGYLSFGSVIAAIWFIRRKPELRSQISSLFILALAAILPILPASMNLIATSGTAGTWHRLLFVPGVIAIVGGVFVISKIDSRQFRVVSTLTFALPFLIAFPAVRSYWITLHESYKGEGLMYLEENTRLIESKVPAFWFLEGVHKYFTPQDELHFYTSRMPLETVDQLKVKYGQ